MGIPAISLRHGLPRMGGEVKAVALCGLRVRRLVVDCFSKHWVKGTRSDPVCVFCGLEGAFKHHV